MIGRSPLDQGAKDASGSERISPAASAAVRRALPNNVLALLRSDAVVTVRGALLFLLRAPRGFAVRSGGATLLRAANRLRSPRRSPDRILAGDRDRRTAGQDPPGPARRDPCGRRTRCGRTRQSPCRPPASPARRARAAPRRGSRP